MPTTPMTNAWLFPPPTREVQFDEKWSFVAQERKHELLVSYTTPDLKLEADSTRLEQILVNLLTNAAKYTPAGGRIQLIAGVEGGEVVFRIRDNGLGILPELLPKMFDLFAQGDRQGQRTLTC